MGAWIEVRYAARGSFGKSYGSGSTRMYANELAEWVMAQTADGPVLVTEIVVVKGELGTKAE